MKKRFLETVSKVFRVKASELSMRTGRQDVSEWDSLGHLKLFLALEREFKMSFPAQKIMRYHDLGEIFRDIEKEDG